jgi:hypothetical protein
MTGDPEQGYFVDGLVEDIITGLSRFKMLFVIARNSSFAYKGKSPDIRRGSGRGCRTHPQADAGLYRRGCAAAPRVRHAPPVQGAGRYRVSLSRAAPGRTARMTEQRRLAAIVSADVAG